MTSGGGQLTAFDADVRADVIASTDRSMLVEAAAGTGKTTLLVDRILHAVRSGAVRLSRAVAITFTEKAAGELEERIRAGLAAESHRAGLTDQERNLVRQAADEIDRAHICTIHAFCARVLREKPLEAGVDPQFAVLDPTAERVLRERVWREWLDDQAAAAPDVLTEALRAGVGAARLQGAAFALAGAPELLEDGGFRLPSPERTRAQIEDALPELGRRAHELFTAHMKGRGNEHSRALARAAATLADAPSPASVRRAAYAVARVPIEKAVKSIDKAVRDGAGETLERLSAAAVELGALLCVDVYEWLAGFVEHYASAKRVRSVLDFQDMLLLTARLLRRTPAARRYFQHRFDAFFVDEFQDTDPLQAELIAFLCEDEDAEPAGNWQDVKLRPGRLFLVGDPKQSIYRFRRADVQVYGRFRELMDGGEGEGGGLRLIHCNFRSSAALLDWFNALFGELFVPADCEDVYQAEHVPLHPPEGAPAVPGPPVVAVCPPPGLPVDEWKAAASRRHEADCLAGMVRALVAGDLTGPGGPAPYRFGDFAFLFRALTDADIYEEALERSGIPYRVVGGRHFYRREQVVEALSVLQAVDDPLNEAAVVGALRSSFFGFSDEDLFRYRKGGGRWNYLVGADGPEPVRSAMKALAGWHRVRNRMPPQRLLREILGETKALEAFLLKPAGPQRVANLEKLVNQLRVLAAVAGSFGAVVRHLSAVQEAELPEEESSVVEPGGDFVRLMSMHRAKGLQFPAVVLPDLARSLQRTGPSAALVYNRLAKEVALQIAPGLRSPGYDRLQQAEAGNELAEQRRLLYVACTRAERLLVLPLHWTAKPRGESFQRVLADSGRVAPADTVPFGEETDGILYVDTTPWAEQGGPSVRVRPGAGTEGADGAALLAARTRWQDDHRVLVARAGAGHRFVLPSDMELDTVPSPLAEETMTGAGGLGFGTLFHSVMAALPLSGTGRDELPRTADRLAEAEAAAAGLDAEAAREVADLAVRALQNEEFASLLAEADRVDREMAFSVPLGRLSICADDTPGFLEGSVDLLLRGPGGVTILDYKSDRFAASERRRVEERYWPQLALYALAAQACGLADGRVELALYFVRTGHITRRPLDDELVRQVAAQVAAAL